MWSDVKESTSNDVLCGWSIWFLFYVTSGVVVACFISPVEHLFCVMCVSATSGVFAFCFTSQWVLVCAWLHQCSICIFGLLRHRSNWYVLDLTSRDFVRVLLHQWSICFSGSRHQWISVRVLPHQWSAWSVFYRTSGVFALCFTSPVEYLFCALLRQWGICSLLCWSWKMLRAIGPESVSCYTCYSCWCTSLWQVSFNMVAWWIMTHHDAYDCMWKDVSFATLRVGMWDTCSWRKNKVRTLHCSEACFGTFQLDASKGLSSETGTSWYSSAASLKFWDSSRDFLKFPKGFSD